MLQLPYQTPFWVLCNVQIKATAFGWSLLLILWTKCRIIEHRLVHLRKDFDMAGRPRKRPRGYGELAFMEEYRNHSVNDLAMKYDVAPSTIKAWESDIRLNGYSQPELSQESGSIISLGLMGLVIIAIMNWM